MRELEYDIRQDIVSKLVKEAQKVSEEIGSESIKNIVNEIKAKIERDAFYLVILGQFKRGKSTLINYVLGENLLPTGVLPLTSVITKLYYSPEIKIEVIFNNDSKKEISIDELYLYCTEKGNPKNEKGVKSIEIGYPFDFLNKDIVIIDTPGIGSIYQHNTDVTYEFIDKSDAVVFVLSVDPPITEVEKQFLIRIVENVDKVFFVINKSDLASQNELEEIRNFTAKVIKEVTGKDDINIYPISAKMALDGKIYKNQDLIIRSGILSFENDLKKFLVDEKESVLILNNLKSLDAFFGVCKAFLESDMRMRIIPLKQLEENIKKFNEFLEKVSQNKNEIYKLFKVEMNDILQRFDDGMENIKKELVNKITKKIENFYPSISKLKRIEQKEQLEKYLESSLIEEFELLKGQLEKVVENQYKSLIERYCNKINDVIENIKDTANQLFLIDLEYYEGLQSFVSKSKFTYKIGYEVGALEIDPVYFTYLLPKRFAQKIILSRVLNRVEIDVDRNIGRIRYDFLRRMEESFDAFKMDMEEKISQVCGIITELLRNSKEDFNKSKSKLEKKIQTNQKLLEKITKLKNEISQIILNLTR